MMKSLMMCVLIHAKTTVKIMQIMIYLNVYVRCQVQIVLIIFSNVEDKTIQKTPNNFHYFSQLFESIYIYLIKTA